MRTAAPTRRTYLQLAATVVACAILCVATTASAQQPAAKVQRYAEVSDRSAALAAVGVDFDRWLQSGGRDELSGIKGYAITPVAVSANAAVVAGTFKTSPKETAYHIFVWSKADGFKDIGKLVGGDSFSLISADGSVVWQKIGFAKAGFETHLMRWSRTGGVKELGRIEGIRFVTAASADCSEIVGFGGIGSNGEGFRWTQQDGVQNFPMDRPLDVSADGTVILGTKGDRVIRWTQVGGVRDLGTLKTDRGGSVFPRKASADRVEIVGRLDIEAHDNVQGSSHAFLWTQASGLQDLGSLGGKNAELSSVSGDGSLVAGYFNTTGKTVYFVSPVADLVAKRQAELKQEQAAQAEKQAKDAAAQAEQDAKNDAVAADQQARYDKVIKTGRPIQLYALAGHMEDEGRPDLAANLYQALIDKFPDDPYAAKAVDKEDAARAASQQQQAQDSAGQTAANAASPQAVEACIQQCSTTLNSCKADAQNQHDSAVAKGLVGLLTRNSGSVSSAGTDSQNADDAKSACNDAYNSCSVACQ
jgi:hypothetical protein